MTRFLMIVLFFTATADADTVERYRAVLDASGAIAPNLDGNGQPDGTFRVSQETRFTGLADFTLTAPAGGGSPTLAYTAVFDGVDFGGQDADPTNNVTAIHLHDTTGVFNSANTPHVLNIFGFPSQDDAQVDVDAPMSTVTGVWDDGDLTDPSLGHALNPMANSDTLTSSLAALRAGELFLMLHTTSPDSLGPLSAGATIGGRLVLIPEPATAWFVAGALILVGGRGSRRA